MSIPALDAASDRGIVLLPDAVTVIRRLSFASSRVVVAECIRLVSGGGCNGAVLMRASVGGIVIVTNVSTKRD